MLVRFVKSWKWLTALIMVGSIGLLALPLAFGRETNGAKNWFYIGGYSVQPSEIVKLALLWCLAYLLSQELEVYPVISYSRLAHMQDNLRSLQIKLDERECKWLNLEV